MRSSSCGFPLFQRAKGRLTPTTEALALYPHIERLFAQLDEVQRLAAQPAHGAAMRASCASSAVLALSYEMLPRALKAFREKHPGIAITVESLHSPQIMSALLLQEADVGFAFSPAVHPSLTQETLADSRMVCIAPKGMLPRALVRNAALWRCTTWSRSPVVGLDSRDPVGTSLSQACRQAAWASAGGGHGADLPRGAGAWRTTGWAWPLVDGCTAGSADRGKVDVLELEPHIPVPIRALLLCRDGPTRWPCRAITRCLQQGDRAQTRLKALGRSAPDHAGDALAPNRKPA